MWYRMSRSWRGVLAGAVVLACLLLAVSAALADNQNQREDRDKPDKGQQAQASPNGQGHPASRPVPAGRQQDAKPAQGPIQVRGAPAELPRNNPSAGGNWQRGRWGRDNSASEPSGNRPVWGQPASGGKPEANRPSGGQTTGSYTPGRWTYRPTADSRTPQAVPYRPTGGNTDTTRDRQVSQRTEQTRPVAQWQQRTRPTDNGSAREQGNRTARDSDSWRVSIPEQRDRNQERQQVQFRSENQVRPGNRNGPNEAATSRLNQRQARIPEAVFRGSEAQQNITSLPKGEGARVKQELRNQLRQMNLRQGKPNPKPVQDVVGNTVTTNAQVVFRSRLSHVSVSYKNIHVALGEPTYHYVFLPRTHAAYWDGYWDGYADGYWAGRHLYHHSVVVLSFYYPYYYSDPHWVAFWYADLYPSVYHYWGWCPPWVFPQRVYYAPVEYVYVPRTPYRYYYTGYHLDESGAQQAVEDIRRSWLRSDIDLLAYHLTDQQDIQVYFDGKYEYTTSTEDYYGMTADAMATTATVAMDFDRPIWISSHEVFYTGRHVFYDPDGIRNSVYVSYRLRRLGGEWYIVAIGSSLEPIRHKYRDFRYS